MFGERRPFPWQLKFDGFGFIARLPAAAPASPTPAQRVTLFLGMSKPARTTTESQEAARGPRDAGDVWDVANREWNLFAGA